MVNPLNASSNLMPVVYIPHGGGPMPLLGEPGHKDLVGFLSSLPNQLPKPKAIVMISAHWEGDIVRVSSSPNPAMIYDYGGFPQKAYEFQYPAPGKPELAQDISRLLSQNTIEHYLDAHRGYDHGTFVPLMLMYPKANIPIVQVSLLRSLDPARHIAIGQALAPLREQGVLLVGSGMSSHNLNVSLKNSQAFDHWLTDVLTSDDTVATRKHLEFWQRAPSALHCHPREEHLMPLHVCFGAIRETEKPAEKIFSNNLYQNQISAFWWR